MKRAIEDSFPIVEINRLAVPERNAFKPIYQMHKWFARRASCVFRAILLGALKPLPTDDKGKPTKSGAQVIMDEFYKDHTADPDTNGKVILDPFMGGGTTVVEALRLGCKVIGIDLNPVAWFIVKTEVEPVDIDELKAAFDRLANRRVEWSGKSLRETLLEQYKTECPCCGNTDADIIYTFWVKSAICHNKLCPARSGDQGAEVPLFSDYIVAYKKPSIRYWPDVSCPKCGKTFDWEIDPAALVADKNLMGEDARSSAGEGRGNVRWAYGPGKSICCPWCREEVTPLPKSTRLTKKGPRSERKKVPLTVLLCPHCESIWQWRGDLPETVSCPSCKKIYKPHGGNIAEKAKFVCPSCGQQQAVIESIRQLLEDMLLPVRPYAIEAHCPNCDVQHSDEEDDDLNVLIRSGVNPHVGAQIRVNHSCVLSKTSGKLYKRVTAADLTRYQFAKQKWETERARLPYPKQKIPAGQETQRLLEHHYCHWHQMFNNRQLLCLATLLAGVLEETDTRLREQLLMCLSGSLDTNNMFTRYMPARNSQGGQTAQGVFARRDFQLKATIAEQNVWGLNAGGIGTFSRKFALIVNGKPYLRNGWEVQYKYDGTKRIRVVIPSGGVIPKIANGVREIFKSDSSSYLLAQDTRTMRDIPNGALRFVVSDPPYAGNVNYAELADF